MRIKEKSVKKVENFERFSIRYNELKIQGKWHDMIALCNNVLVHKKLNIGDEIAVKNKLAGCYFCLSDYEKAIFYSNIASIDAEKVGETNQQVKALYLISASCRLLGKNDHARKSIRKALDLLEDDNVARLTKAKIYYSAGSVEGDLFNNLEDAIVFYGKAMKIFEKGEFYNNTAFMHIRANLECNKLHAAKIAVENLEKVMQNDPKSMVNLLLLKLEVCFALGEYTKSYLIVREGSKLAADNKMKEKQAQFELWAQEHWSKLSFSEQQQVITALESDRMVEISDKHQSFNIMR